MANFDRIDLMNFVKYGNDFDDQWDEIRNFIKSSSSAQKELEDIKRTLPQQNSSSRRRVDSMDRTSQEGRLQSNPLSQSSPRDPGQEKVEQKKWWSKLLGED
jgi:hypothetical protein